MTGVEDVTQLRIAELEKRLEIEERENGKHENEIERLEREIEDLEDEIREAPDDTAYIAVLERFADHRNWADGRYAPAIAEIYDHPADIAAAVLRENL